MKKGMRWGMAAAGLLLLLANQVSAQMVSATSEITVYGGGTFDGANSGTGGAALTLNMMPRIGAEAEIGAIFASDKIININVDFIYNVGSGTSILIPYLIGGAGVLSNGGTNVALNAGVGVKLFVDVNIALRADFRGFFTSNSGKVDNLARIYGGIDFFF